MTNEFDWMTDEQKEALNKGFGIEGPSSGDLEPTAFPMQRPKRYVGSKDSNLVYIVPRVGQRLPPPPEDDYA